MDSEIDAKTFWKAIGCRAIGVAIVTAKGTDGPAGFLALSATHLSASPPMMMVSIGLTTSALGAVRQSNHFAINYVPKGADALVKEFAGQGSLKGADRFLAGAWGTLKTGAPTLNDAVGVIDCRLDELIERHGTVIALGRVVAYSASTQGAADQLPRRLSMKLAASLIKIPGIGCNQIRPAGHSWMLREEHPMTYLDLAPAITALRARPEEFEFTNDTLHHPRSRHRFRFNSEGDVQIDALCDCSLLRARPEQAKAFHTAYREWHASYWRPLEINREFASHFGPSPLWRRAAVWLLNRLLSGPKETKPVPLPAGAPMQPAE